MLSTKKIAVAVVMTSLGLSGCENMPIANETAIGTGIGAVTGALIGKQTNAKNGALYGALAGAAAGGMIGSHIAKKKQAAEAALQAEIENGQAQVDAVGESGEEALRLTVAGSALFETGQANPLPSAYPLISKIATQANSGEPMKIKVVGHTDSVGNKSANMRLSMQRANAVKNALKAYGVRNIISIGRGDAEPVASNGSADGRAQNRRVEVYLEPLRS